MQYYIALAILCGAALVSWSLNPIQAQSPTPAPGIAINWTGATTTTLESVQIGQITDETSYNAATGQTTVTGWDVDTTLTKTVISILPTKTHFDAVAGISFFQ